MTHEEGFREAQYRVDNIKGFTLNLNDLNLTRLPDMTHLKNIEFLFLNNNALTSLKGCPPKVDNLYCSNNKLTSLEHSPACDLLTCYSNNLKNLKHYRCKARYIGRRVKHRDGIVVYDNPLLLKHRNLLEYYKLDWTDIAVWRHYENYFNT